MELKHYIGSCIASFLLFMAAILTLNPQFFAYFEPTFQNLFLGLITTLYPSIVGIISTFLLSKDLKSGLVAAILVGSYYLITGNYENIFYGSGGAGEIFAAALSLLSVNILVSGIEYVYRNPGEAKSALAKINIQYSIYAGWLHTVFGFCLAILTYGPEHINEFIFSLRFLTGFTGTFLLVALPIYLYLEGKEKLPVIVTGSWIGWGIINFMLEFEDLPVNVFFPAPEFFIPPAPGYLFSSYLPLGLIVVYVAIRRANLEVYRKELRSYLL